MLQLDAGGSLHVLEDQVVERADAHAAIGRRLVGRLARQGDQFVDAVDRQILAGDEHHHGIGHRMHQTEVLRLQLHCRIGQRRQDHLVGRTLEEVVAVGRRGQHLLRRQRAADTAQVFHQHLLAQLFAERVEEDARDRIGRAARRTRNHQVDQLGRVALRRGKPVLNSKPTIKASERWSAGLVMATPEGLFGVSTVRARSM